MICNGRSPMQQRQHADECASLVIAGQRPCCCPAKAVGALAALTAPGVEPALPATIDVPSQPGEVAAYSDFRGSIYRFPMGDGVILNLMHTVAGADGAPLLTVHIWQPLVQAEHLVLSQVSCSTGSMRSGDMHNCTQFDIALRGRSRLRQLVSSSPFPVHAVCGSQCANV